MVVLVVARTIPALMERREFMDVGDRDRHLVRSVLRLGRPAACRVIPVVVYIVSDWD